LLTIVTERQTERQADRPTDGTGSGFLTRDPTRPGGFLPGDPTRPDRSLKQILDNGLIAVSVTCQES